MVSWTDALDQRKAKTSGCVSCQADEADRDWWCRPNEAKVREKLWLTMNKDYVEQQAAKQKAADVVAQVSDPSSIPC